MSTILALRLKRKGYDISQVVAFGMPLVVWQGAAQGAMAELALDIPLLRVEHPLDPIPHFPGKFSCLVFLSSNSRGVYTCVGELIGGVHGNGGSACVVPWVSKYQVVCRSVHMCVWVCAKSEHRC